MTKWACGAALMLALTGEVRAQFFFAPFPVGYSYGSGLGFRYHGHHLSIGGFTGYNTFGFYPYAFSPFGGGFYPYGGFFPYAYGGGFFPYGMATTSVSINYIVPPPPGGIFIGPSRRRVVVEDDDDDLSGVDLDVVDPEVLEGGKPKPRRVAPPADLPGIDDSVPKKPLRPREAPLEPPPPQPKKPRVVPRPAKPLPPRLPPPQQDPLDECARLLKIGRDAFGEQAYGVAAQHFRQAGVLNPREPWAFFLLNQAQFALGKYREAVASIHQGMRLHPGWPREKFRPRRDLYKDHPDFAVHLKRLETVLAQNPKKADYLFLLGHQLWFQGERDQAVVLFRRARPLSADPAFIDRFLKAAVPANQLAVK